MTNELSSGFSEIYVSNSVYTGVTDTCFDLHMIYKNFKLSEDFVKIQYNNKQKIFTKKNILETDCKTFYNQISLSLRDKTNIKLFNNGNFQISGVKSQEEALNKLFFAVKDLNQIYGEISVVPKVIDNILTYNKRIIVRVEDRYECKHVYKNGFFVINKEVCVVSEFDNRILISDRHVNKRKNLYNINCEYIGYLDYIMIRKNKNLCLKDTFLVKESDNKYSIFNKYTVRVGSIEITITGNIIDHISLSEDSKKNGLTISYNACSGNITPNVKSISLANINCNIKYILSSKESLDRYKICETLANEKVKYVYDPCKYPGIKLELYGTKITIFRTGSILFSGKDDISKIINWIKNLFDKNNFKKLHLSSSDKYPNEEYPACPVKTDLEIYKNISIWDIMD